MGFNIKKQEHFKYTSPQEMYQDNKRKEIRGLLDYQSKMIDQYMENCDKNNVALELPTGTGKTLIGLLIGEYRRRSNKEKVVFLCPTKQLVNQVANQANEKYGINVITLIGKQREYSPRDVSSFNMGEAIAITTYSAFFTQESIFNDVDVIIMDDVHSCEEYIVSNWTLKILKKDSLFLMLANELKDIIGESNYERLTYDESTRDVGEWCDLVPITLFLDILHTVERHIDSQLQTPNSSNYYSWKRIKENLGECNIYINNREIQIRPWIPPTMTYLPYKNAKQRILMSATLGKSGELERITGIKNIYRLPIVNDWDKRGLGRRFFIIPELSLDDKYIEEIFFELHNSTNKKTVTLVPDDSYVQNINELIEKYGAEITSFQAKDIEKSKTEFIKSENAMTILSNRFDGIDFADDESRMLFIVDLPKVTNMQEKFLISRMSATILFGERIQTRIIQAVGRCSRNPSDYSVVCILGDTIQNDLLKPEKLGLYPPELRAELKFGIEMSTQYQDISQVLEQVTDFLDRNDSWQEAEDYIVSLRDEYCNEKNNIHSELFNKLKDASKYELEYQYAIWRKNYIQAYNSVRDIIGSLNAPALAGYKSYWEYIAGSLAYICFKSGDPLYENIGINHYKNILKDGLQIKWAEKLIYQLSNKAQTSQNNNFSNDLIHRIEENLIKYNTDLKFDKCISSIIADLQSGGTAFERGHKNLGEILGYISINHSSPAAPDPYWIVEDYLCIVSEDKIYENEEKEIPVSHVREAIGHEKWILNNEKTISDNCKLYTVFITNSNAIEANARPFATGIWYVNKEDFVKWGINALNSVKEMRKTFVEIGDIEWRAQAIKIMQINEVTPRDLLNLIKTKELAQL